jgi:hypothetical protein
MNLAEKLQSSVQELLYKRSVNSGNNLGVEGFIDLELVSNQGNVKYKRRFYQHNAITPAGKQMLLAHSAQDMLNMGGDYSGRLATLSALYMRRSGYASVREANSNRDITNLLLNLVNPTALTDSSGYIPVLSANGEKSNASTVVGYANSDTTPPADGKAGASDYALPEYLVDGKTVAKRWKYKEGVATGTINAIAMAPLAVYGHGSRGLGLRSAKCLDKVNFTYQNFGAFSTGFCPPGIAGITGDTEVLLNYSQDSISQHKYDLSTGVTSDITSGWAGIPFPRNSSSNKISDYFYDGTRYLYIIDLNGNIAETSYAYVTIYDTQGGILTYLTNFAVYSPTSGYMNGAYFLKSGTDVYVSILGSLSSGSGGVVKLTKSGAYYNGSVVSDYSFLGLTAPTGLVAGEFAIKSLASGRYALITAAMPQKTETVATDHAVGMYAKHAYVFTDLTKPFDSIVGVIEWMTNYGCIVSTASVTGFLSVDFYNYSASQASAYDTDGANQSIKNNSYPSGKQNSNPNGVWWSDLTWSSNVVSHVELTTPVTKGATDILYVTYGYKIT